MRRRTWACSSVAMSLPPVAIAPVGVSAVSYCARTYLCRRCVATFATIFPVHLTRAKQVRENHADDVNGCKSTPHILITTNKLGQDSAACEMWARGRNCETCTHLGEPIWKRSRSDSTTASRGRYSLHSTRKKSPTA